MIWHEKQLKSCHVEWRAATDGNSRTFQSFTDCSEFPRDQVNFFLLHTFFCLFILHFFLLLLRRTHSRSVQTLKCNFRNNSKLMCAS